MKPVHYTLVPKRPAAHLFEVTVTVADPDPDAQRFMLPVWIPGSYMVREFARHIVTLRAFDAAGNDVRMTKTDKHTWQAAPLARHGGGDTLTLRYEVYAWDLSVRAAHLDDTGGFFNGASVFLAVCGHENAHCIVDIQPPPEPAESPVQIQIQHDGADARASRQPCAAHAHDIQNAQGTQNRQRAHGAQHAHDTHDTREHDAHNANAYRNWRVATALPRARGTRRYGFGEYRAANYDELIDHPVTLGEFALATFHAHGVPHDIAIAGRVIALDMDRLAADLKRICEAQIALFEPDTKRAPLAHYVFMTQAVSEGYGGLEHRASTALICNRGDLPVRNTNLANLANAANLANSASAVNLANMANAANTANALANVENTAINTSANTVTNTAVNTAANTAANTTGPMSEGYRTYLGLCSHEYFHTWNVKRIKPAAFAPYDLARENYTSLLWLFEGFTSYYDDLMLVRSGVIGEDDYFALLGKNAGSVRQGAGRFKQSVAQSSFDAWIKYYRQDENAANAIVSYYTKGALVALAFDLSIRAQTSVKNKSGAHKSLDDVMRLLWQRYGRDFYHGKPAGVGEDEIKTLIAEATGVELGALFDDAVHGTRDLPLATLFEPFGMTLRAEPQQGGRPSLGVRVKGGGGAGGVNNADCVLAVVYEDRAAQRAGLSAGDVLIALDGLRVSSANLDSLLARYRPGDAVDVHAFRRDELRSARVVLDGPDVARYRLTVSSASGPTGQASQTARRLRERWLKG